MSAKGGKPDTWMPMFIGDYLADTGRLNTEQHGAYLLLIFDYWRSGPLSDDDEELAGIARLDIKTWRRHRPKLERYFAIADGQWRHKRVDQELAAAQDKSDRASERAALAARARWGDHTPPSPPGTPVDRERNAPGTPSRNAASNASRMLEDCPSPSPIPTEEGPNGPVGSVSPLKAEVDRLWSLAPAQGRARSSRKDVERALKAALRRGHSVDEVAEGVAAYYDSDAATKDGGEFAKGLHRLIENDRWQAMVGPSAETMTAIDPMLRPEDWRQRKWMEEHVEGRFQWNPQRGPRPGEPGCRVSPEIQREFGVEPAKPQPVEQVA